MIFFILFTGLIQISRLFIPVILALAFFSSWLVLKFIEKPCRRVIRGDANQPNRPSPLQGNGGILQGRIVEMSTVRQQSVMVPVVIPQGVTPGMQMTVQVP